MEDQDSRYIIVLDVYDVISAFAVGIVFGIELGLMIEAHLMGVL